MTDSELMTRLVEVALAYAGPVGGLNAVAARVVALDPELAAHIAEMLEGQIELRTGAA